jgi:hypothetical protein
VRTLLKLLARALGLRQALVLVKALARLLRSLL